MATVQPSPIAVARSPDRRTPGPAPHGPRTSPGAGPAPSRRAGPRRARRPPASRRPGTMPLTKVRPLVYGNWRRLREIGGMLARSCCWAGSLLLLDDLAELRGREVLVRPLGHEERCVPFGDGDVRERAIALVEDPRRVELLQVEVLVLERVVELVADRELLERADRPRRGRPRRALRLRVVQAQDLAARAARAARSSEAPCGSRPSRFQSPSCAAISAGGLSFLKLLTTKASRPAWSRASSSPSTRAGAADGRDLRDDLVRDRRHLASSSRPTRRPARRRCGRRARGGARRGARRCRGDRTGEGVAVLPQAATRTATRARTIERPGRLAGVMRGIRARARVRVVVPRNRRERPDGARHGSVAPFDAGPRPHS